MSRASCLMLAMLLCLWAPRTEAHPEGDCLVFAGAQIWLPGGSETSGTVVTVGERIALMSQGDEPLELPDWFANEFGPDLVACVRMDLSGDILTPGLVDPYTQLGLVEIDLEAATRDHTPGASTVGKSSVRPSFRVWPAFNPRSPLMAVARSGGITGVLTAPTGGRVSGQSAWVDLIQPTARVADALPEFPSERRSPTSVTDERFLLSLDPVRPDAVAVHVHLGSSDGSRAEGHWDLNLLLQEARLWKERRQQWARNQHRPFRFPATELDAMQPVLDGSRILAVHVERASDIEGALQACSGLRCVLVGAAEAWIVKEALAKTGIPVVIDPLLNAPESFDRLQARPDNAAILARAGVPVAFSTFSSHNVRTLRQAAGNAIRAGLPQEAARAAVTEVPAAAFGRPDRGVLVPGAVANLVLWSGDPFELSTRVKRMWIRGKHIPLTSRQDRLRDRYRQLPGSPSPSLSLP